MLYMATGKLAHLGCKFVSSKFLFFAMAFTLHVSGDNLTHHQEVHMQCMATGKVAHLGCKFVSSTTDKFTT